MSQEFAGNYFRNGKLCYAKWRKCWREQQSRSGLFCCSGIFLLQVEEADLIALDLPMPKIRDSRKVLQFTVLVTFFRQCYSSPVFVAVTYIIDRSDVAVSINSNLMDARRNQMLCNKEYLPGERGWSGKPYALAT